MKKMGLVSWEEFKKDLEERYGSLENVEQIMKAAELLDILDVIEHVEEYLNERSTIKMTETSWTIDDEDELKRLFAVIYMMYMREPFDIIDVQIFWDLEKEVRK